MPSMLSRVSVPPQPSVAQPEAVPPRDTVTDEGLVGLGETFMGAQAVEAYVHEWAGPKLLGKDPLESYMGKLR